MKTTTLLTTSIISLLLLAGQTAFAGDDVDKDEYSPGYVAVETQFSDTNRVNYFQDINEEASALDKELFPEGEGR